MSSAAATPLAAHADAIVAAAVVAAVAPPATAVAPPPAAHAAAVVAPSASSAIVAAVAAAETPSNARPRGGPLDAASTVSPTRGHLASNNLTGTLPTELGKLTRMFEM
ncbi:hypothetical protein CYMTET_24192 [Cymbomonas tetramitiformis]|uniref:Uncharacterized protein n=1 Tax=Cymbomonas tetramitiformis TaxID=36881 RepID=A0AAE0FWV4_9CHLO|nr:hypothetical protein CYMTET_24192 [Cymbomonas tetramitiformis]